MTHTLKKSVMVSGSDTYSSSNMEFQTRSNLFIANNFPKVDWGTIKHCVIYNLELTEYTLGLNSFPFHVRLRLKQNISKSWF